MVNFYTMRAELQDALVSLLKENIAWLSGNVWKNTFRTNTSWPQAYVMGTNDELELINRYGGGYHIRAGYAIILQTPKIGTADMDRYILVSGVGAIMDQLNTKPYRFEGRVRWERMEAERIDYEYVSPGMTESLISEARIDVRAERDWPP